jgi:cell wall-associated NlpC family hydrolase
VRAGPRDDAEQVTQALPGEPLTVRSEEDGWVRIRTAYDYPGWVRADALDGALDEEWLVERGGDPVEEARAYLGCPYEWGGLTEKGIDCSGLIHMAYRRLGRLVPRDADQQEAAGTPVSRDELRRGDLVCYGDHIAFWLGDGRILHATGRKGVRAVVEEQHPPELAAQVRGYVRLGTVPAGSHPSTGGRGRRTCSQARPAAPAGS